MGLTRITAQQISDSDFKQSVRVVSTANTNLTGGAPDVVDSITLVLNDRILVVGQSTASQNGLYYVTTLGNGSNGTWTRTTDGNASGEISSGMILIVTEGTAYGDSEWLLTTDNPILIGTTSLTFIQLNATIYNGTSNVSIVNSGNVVFGSAGTANVALISATGVYVNTNLYVSTDAVITGNLTVNGTTTTINSNTITTNDKTITVANNQSTGAGVDGSGFDAGGGTPIATWRYNNATTSWQSNVGVTPSANASQALGGASNYWGTAYITTVLVTGNVTGGNVITAGVVSASGNISGNYILGNGSQLTGVATSYGNANVVANVAALGSNPVSTTGNVTGGYILGNGSQLTGIAASYGNANVVANVAALGSNPVSTTGNITGGNLIQGTTRVYKWTTATSAPANPVAGDEWYNSSTDVLYKYIDDSVGSQWVDQSFPTSFGNITIAGNANVTGTIAGSGNLSVSGNIGGGYILGSGNISLSGNVTGNYILGNGSLLTGVGASYGNSNVVANLAALGSNPVSTTGNITAGYFIGDGSALTSITATTAGTVTTAAQGNITSVGILTSLSVTGNVTGGNVTGTNLYGTLQTATQLNVTGLGTLTTLIVSGNTTSGNLLSGGLISVAGNVTGGNINTAGQVSAAGNVTGNYILGNGSQLTGLSGTSSAAAVGYSLIFGG